MNLHVLPSVSVFSSVSPRVPNVDSMFFFVTWCELMRTIENLVKCGPVWRYYSRLIDGEMPKDHHDDTRYRIELLANHLVPFASQTLIQKIDGNQNIYCEQTVMVPSAFETCREMTHIVNIR